jgi:uncharacterized protein (DUF58 family)
MRPSRAAAPVAIAMGVLSIWWLVAHNAGSGWVQALGDVVFGAIVIGMVGPSIVLARAKVHVVSSPSDAIAGTPTELAVSSSTRLRIRARGPFNGESFVGPVGGQRSSGGRLMVLSEHRGVHDVLPIDVATAAPFALQWWTRRIELPLPSALHVAPRSGRPESLPMRPYEDTGIAVDWVQSDIGQPRGARPYQPGDSQRQVHWHATAHAGELMVRELERPSAEPLTVTVVLPADPREAERVAERALGTIVRLLDQGSPVLLATSESSGPVRASVTDRRGAGRRLARAVAGSDASSRISVNPSSP